MALSFWVEVTKTLIGTAAESLLGFGSALLVWRVQQSRTERAAGNIAVLTLAQYVRAL